MTDNNDRLLRVLLVEDSRADARLTEEALHEGPIPTHVDWVTNGVEAMQFLRREPPYNNARPPDLVLLDLNMPRMDGRETLKTIKTDPNLRDMPVIVLTTSSAEVDVLQSYQLQANAFITKPVTLDALIEDLSRLRLFWFETATIPSRQSTVED